MKTLAIGAREPELRAVPQYDDRVARKPRLHFDDAIDIDDVAAMNANECARVELRLNARRGHPNQVARAGDVQPNVIPVSLPPIHVGRTNDLEDAIHLHRDAI